MPQKKRIEDIQKGRTNLFSLRWRDCEPAKLGKEKLNTRTDFGDIGEFALSLADGIREPLLGYMGENGKFQITNGERRWRGAQWLEEKKGVKILLPCSREPQGFKDVDRNLDLLRTNNGKPLEMLEKAEAMNRLLAANMAPKEIAAKAGCSITHVTDCLALLGVSPEVKEAVRSGEMKGTLAVDLARAVPDKEKQTEILHQGRQAAAHAKPGRLQTPKKPKVTAKHLPVATGKKAQAKKKEERTHEGGLKLTGASFSEPRGKRPIGIARPSGRDKTLDMLEELIDACPRSECESKERYDTLEFLIEYASGHKGLATATKFILGII